MLEKSSVRNCASSAVFDTSVKHIWKEMDPVWSLEEHHLRFPMKLVLSLNM